MQKELDGQRLSGVSKVYVGVVAWINHSLFFRIVDVSLQFIQKLFSGSILIRALHFPITDEQLHASCFVKVIDALWNALIRARERFFRTAFENSLSSRIFSGLNGFFQASFIGTVIYRVLKIEKRDAFTLPELGLLMIAALTPFLPTMALAGLLGLIFVCFVFKLLTDAHTVVMDQTGLLVIIYAAIGIFYGFTSFTPDSSLSIALLISLLMISYFLTVTLINTDRKLKALIFIFSFSAAVAGLFGLYQKISGQVDMTWVDRELFSDLRLRIYSTFANPNVYGAYLLLAIPLCAVMVYVSGRFYLKLYYAAVTLLLLYNLGYTFSRGCYLAMALGAFVFVLFMAKRLIALFAAGLVAAVFLLPPTMYTRFASILNFGSGDSSTSYRLDIWQGTLRILRDFWFSGLGQGIQAYNTVYPYYAFNGVSAPHSHSLYLQVWVETGIFGLIVFIALLFSFFRTQVTLYNRTSDRRVKCLQAGFMCAVIAFLFQGGFDYVFYNYRVLLTFFLFIGMGGALVNQQTRRELL